MIFIRFRSNVNFDFLFLGSSVATELLRAIQQLTASFSSNHSNFQSKVPTLSQSTEKVNSIPAPSSEVSKTTIPQTVPVNTAPPPMKTSPVVKEPPKPAFSFTIATTDRQMEELVTAMQEKEKHQIVLQILHRSLRENQEKAFQLFFDAFLGYFAMTAANFPCNITHSIQRTRSPKNWCNERP